MIPIATIKLDQAGSVIDVAVQSDQVVRVEVAGVAVAMLARTAAELRDALSLAIVRSGRAKVEIDADHIVMALRHQFSLLEELKKRAPAEYQRIYEFVFAQCRSAAPMAASGGVL